MNRSGDETVDLTGEDPGRELSPLESRLRALAREGRAGLVPFVTAGYPTREATVPVLAALERSGATAVELGIPFSDPLADGPVRRYAGSRCEQW